MPALKDMPGPTAKIELEEGPLDGLRFDWTYGPNFPIEIKFEFIEFEKDKKRYSEINYEAGFHYLEGEKLMDGIPTNETQVYYYKGTARREVQNTPEETERRKLWTAE